MLSTFWKNPATRTGWIWYTNLRFYLHPDAERAVLRDVNWILNVKSDFYFEIDRRFREEGIEIPLQRGENVAGRFVVQGRCSRRSITARRVKLFARQAMQAGFDGLPSATARGPENARRRPCCGALRGSGCSRGRES